MSLDHTLVCINLSGTCIKYFSKSYSNIFPICNTVQQANPKWFKSVRIGLTNKANTVGWAGNVTQPHREPYNTAASTVYVAHPAGFTLVVRPILREILLGKILITPLLSAIRCNQQV